MVRKHIFRFSGARYSSNYPNLWKRQNVLFVEKWCWKQKPLKWNTFHVVSNAGKGSLGIRKPSGTGYSVCLACTRLWVQPSTRNGKEGQIWVQILIWSLSAIRWGKASDGFTCLNLRFYTLQWEVKLLVCVCVREAWKWQATPRHRMVSFSAALGQDPLTWTCLKSEIQI